MLVADISFKFDYNWYIDLIRLTYGGVKILNETQASTCNELLGTSA